MWVSWSLEGAPIEREMMIRGSSRRSAESSLAGIVGIQ